MNIEKRLAEIRARKAEIRSIIEKDDKADMDALEKELRELNEEAEGLERRQNIERMLNSGAAVANPVSVNNPEPFRGGRRKALPFRVAENLAG